NRDLVATRNCAGFDRVNTRRMKERLGDFGIGLLDWCVLVEGRNCDKLVITPFQWKETWGGREEPEANSAVEIQGQAAGGPSGFLAAGETSATSDLLPVTGLMNLAARCLRHERRLY